MNRNDRKARTRRKRVLPLPEAVTGGKPWTIREAGGKTPYADPTHRQMAVPFNPTPVAEAIRLHEMAHARWSPANGMKQAADAGLLHGTANACEDARMHRKLRDAGFTLRTLLDDATLNSLMQGFQSHRFGNLDAAGLLMASMGTADEPAITRLMREYGFRTVETVVRDIHSRHFGSRRPAFKRTLDAAQDLEDWFREDPDDDVLDALNDPLEAAEEWQDEDDDGTRPYGECEWGAMRITEPVRPLRLPSKIRHRVRRAVVEGSVPRQWNRLALDGAVFSTKRNREAGGAVLIDQSGSMDFTADDVLRILTEAPAAIVATYAGRYGIGELRILAKDGRRVKDEDVDLGVRDNVVDGPALVWLSKQDGPRFWLSDGMATSPAGDAVRAAAKLALRGRVLRVPDLDALLERIK